MAMRIKPTLWTFVHEMACCLMVPSNYLIHRWLIGDLTPTSTLQFNLNQNRNFFIR